VKIAFEAIERSPIALAGAEHIAIAQFIGGDDFFSAGKEMTDLLRRTLETKDRGADFTVVTIAADRWQQRISGKPRNWIEQEQTPNWTSFLSLTDAEILIVGDIDFKSHTYLGLVTETFEDPYSGMPYRRTVRRELTSYDYLIHLGVVDLAHLQLVHQVEIKKSATLEGARDPADFFTIVEPHLQEFVDAISGRRRVERRFLIL